MVQDIRIAVSFRGHRKRKRLHKILGVDGTGFLLDLWLATAENHPNGVLEGMDALDISLEAGWPGDPEKFIAALFECGLLEQCPSGSYALHDWSKHQGYVIHAPARSEKARRAAAARWGHDVSRDATRIPEACPEHADSNAKSESSNAPSPSPSPSPSPNPEPKDKKQSAPNPGGFRADSGTLVCDKSMAKGKGGAPRDDLTAYYLPVKSPDMGKVAYLKAENWQVWTSIYGHEFCLEQLRRAYKWCLDNPAKAKTAKGIHKFFGAWLEKEQNTRGSARASLPRHPPAQPDDSITRTMTAAANVLQRRRERKNANL